MWIQKKTNKYKRKEVLVSGWRNKDEKRGREDTSKKVKIQFEMKVPERQ